MTARKRKQPASAAEQVIDLGVSAAHPSAPGLPMRWVLVLNSPASYGQGPLLRVEQQVSGKWHPAGGGWALSQLAEGSRWQGPLTGDVISIQGDWYASGAQAAIAAAKGRTVPVGPARPGQRFTHGDVEISTELVDMYPAKRGVRGLGCGCSAAVPQLRGVSLTYGQLPRLRAFFEAFAREVPSGDYSMQLNHADWKLVERDMAAAGRGARFGNSTPGHNGLLFDDIALYKLLQAMTKRGNTDFVSGVLSTLGFEWV